MDIFEKYRILVWIVAAALSSHGVATAEASDSKAAAAFIDELALQDRPAIVLVGEWHGTREAPQLLGAFAETAAARGLSVMVLLEQPDSLNPALATLTGEARDRAQLCATGAEFFHRSRDGRATVATSELTLRLGRLAGRGQPVSVRAMDVSHETPFPEGASPMTWRRDHMAGAIAEHASQARLTLVLVGNNHPPALKRRLEAALPGHDLVTLRQAWDAGQAWNCQAGGCEIHPAPASQIGPDLRDGVTTIALTDSLRRYDGYAYVGPISASPPVSVSGWCDGADG